MARAKQRACGADKVTAKPPGSQLLEGRPLAQRLVEAGERVVDVPAKEPAQLGKQLQVSLPIVVQGGFEVLQPWTPLVACRVHDAS
jgi:hypothetical protein